MNLSLGVFLILVSADILMIVFHFTLRSWLGFFDLDREGNLISLWTGIKLWSGATAAFMLALFIKHLGAKRSEWLAWFLLALGLLWIGMDDLLAIHERLTFVLNNIFGSGGFYGESFNWLFYFAPLFFISIAVFCKTAKSAAKWASAGDWFYASIFFAIGAMTVEIYGRQLILEPVVRVARYHLLIPVEEFFELAAATAVVFGCYLTLVQFWKTHISFVDKTDPKLEK